MTAETMLWTPYKVRWTFLTRLCASVPADPEIIQKWLEAREPRVKPAGALSIQEINEEIVASIERGEPEQSYSMLVFQRHGGLLVMRAATVKAHIKDCARVISNQVVGRIKGERAFSTRVINGVYPHTDQYWIPIRRMGGSPIADADGAFDKPIHVRGPHGEPLNALKRFEYIDPPSIMDFTLNVLGRSVSETDLHNLFIYGGQHGYAGERGDGEGRYSYTIERVDAEAERTATPQRSGDHRKARTDSGRT